MSLDDATLRERSARILAHNRRMRKAEVRFWRGALEGLLTAELELSKYSSSLPVEDLERIRWQNEAAPERG